MNTPESLTATRTRIRMMATVHFRTLQSPKLKVSLPRFHGAFLLRLSVFVWLPFQRSYKMNSLSTHSVKHDESEPLRATIKAASSSEALLRLYGLKILMNRAGVSETKSKQATEGLSFNTFLHVILPLSLTQAELCRIRSTIESVDALRRVRNNLVHGHISPEDVDVDAVMRGIEGALRLGAFLQQKLEEQDT